MSQLYPKWPMYSAALVHLMPTLHKNGIAGRSGRCLVLQVGHVGQFCATMQPHDSRDALNYTEHRESRKASVVKDSSGIFGRSEVLRSRKPSKHYHQGRRASIVLTIIFRY